MDVIHDMKALFIIVNAGFSEEVIDIAREAGAGGATVLNARGEGLVHKSILNISLEVEKEMVISIVTKEVAEKTMADIKEKAGIDSDARGICFMLPIENMTEINKHAHQSEEEE